MTWTLYSQHRADIYAWFSSVFALELTDDVIASYQRGDAGALLAAFGSMGLEEQARRVASAVQAWSSVPMLKMELSADFARLFLVDLRGAAAPYASAYLDPEGQLYGEPHRMMQQFLHDNGLKVHAGFKEPADHLAVILACFEAQVRHDAQLGSDTCQGAAEEQARFLDNALLSWLPSFTRQCQQVRADLVTDFYPAVAALLLGFVTEDARSLRSADIVS